MRRRQRRTHRRRRAQRRRRTQRGGIRTPIIQGFWGGAPYDDKCKTLVYRPTDITDPHGSPYVLRNQCEVIGEEGQFATPI